MQSDHLDLEAWVKLAMQKCREANFPAGPFPAMLDRWGAKKAMERCILNTDPDSTPLRKLVHANLGEWSVEQGVLDFPTIFDAEVRKAAQWRLNQATRQE